MNDGQNQQFRGLIRVVSLQAIQQRLLMGKVGFEQHLNFILLLEFPFPVIERGGARQQRGTGGQLVRQGFCRQILAVASSGAVQSTTTASGVVIMNLVSAKRGTIARKMRGY